MVEKQARNTARNKGTSNRKGGDACLTCMVQTSLVMMMEIVCMWHGRSTELGRVMGTILHRRPEADPPGELGPMSRLQDSGTRRNQRGYRKRLVLSSLELISGPLVLGALNFLFLSLFLSGLLLGGLT